MSFEYCGAGDMPPTSLNSLDLAASLVQTPATLEERINTLSNRVNELYAAAWGRGLTPLIDADVANQVADFQTKFLAWRNALGLLAVLNVSADTVAQFDTWEANYNALRSKLPPDKQPAGIADNTLVDWGPILKWGAIAIGGVALLALIAEVRTVTAPLRR